MAKAKVDPKLIKSIQEAKNLAEIQAVVKDLPPEKRNPLAGYVAQAMDRLLNAPMRR